MRDPWGLNERAFAKWYPVVVGWSENAGQREVRAELMASAYGRTLEIGAGSGHNLAHYPSSVTELVVSEPSSHMLQRLRAVCTDDPPSVGSWQLVRAGAEMLPFDDDTFDTVTATYVHCTIADPRVALCEIARVLKPGGQYLYLEHVRATDNRALAGFQDLVDIPHSYLAAGCHPNRRTEQLLAESPLSVQSMQHARMPRCSPTVRCTIRGVATA